MTNEFLRNHRAILLTTLCGVSLLGVALYWIWGWPVGVFPVREFFTGAARDGWFGSPWQLISKKEIVVTGVLIIAAGAAALHSRWWTRAIIFFVVAWLLSLNARTFPLGYGYDIFVHDATVRAWIEQGGVMPRSFLYNGYHALVAALAQITSVRPIAVMHYVVPLIGAIMLSLASDGRTRIWPRLVAFGIIFPSLFTTATPQALGHLLLAGYALITYDRTLRWHVHAIIVAGIFTIHPFSGIAAGALAAFMLLREYQIVRILTAVGVLVLPTISIIIFSGAHIVWTFPALRATVAFNPALGDLLLLYWSMGAPIVFIIATILGTWPASTTQRTHACAAVCVAASGVPLFFLQTTNIIGYEQTAFAQRMLLAGALIALPLAARGIENVWQHTKHTRHTGVLWFGVCAVLVAASWYNAHESWNTVAHTRARQMSPTDIAIVRAIDADAAGAPYVVLADQITAAAALREFGFTHRTLPNRPDYFYPIPTGGEFYTRFFLPSMYEKISRERLTAAARAARVSRVYVVLKPYWRTRPHMDDELQQNTAHSFSVGGALIGRVDLP